MKKEFYIMQVLSWNVHLRTALLSACGVHYQSEDPDYILSDFDDQEDLDQLGRRLGCDPNDVFETLYEKVAETFSSSKRPRLATLSTDDIKLFFDESFLKGVSAILSCPDTSDRVVEVLFDEAPVRELMVAARIIHPDEDIPFSKLFWRLLSPKGASMLAQHLGGSTDLWPVLLALVKESAAATLCKSLSCKAEDIFPCMKARFADARQQGDETLIDESQKLDTLGIAKLSELLRALSGTYLQRAKQVAQNVADRNLTQGGSPLLLALLEFYGNRAYRSGLLSMTTPVQPIRTFSQSDTVRRKSVHEFLSTLELRASPEVNEGKAAVLFECRPQGGTMWETIAVITCPDSKVAKHIAKWLPAHSRYLKGTAGDDMLEAILSHQIPSLGGREQIAFDLWLRKDNSLVAYFVLSGMRIPDQLQVARTFGFLDTAQPLSDKERTVCPSVNEIIDATIEHYRAGGRSVAKL
jgi:hypothetical protein